MTTAERKLSSRTAQETLIQAHVNGDFVSDKEVTAAAALLAHLDRMEIADVLERIANVLEAQKGI
jgi:hypothetical protein